MTESGPAAKSFLNLTIEGPADFGSRDYLCDFDAATMRMSDVQRQQFDTSAEPGASTLAVPGVWSRTQSDWADGSGQEELDSEGSLRSRSLLSVGVEVSKSGQLSLAREGYVGASDYDPGVEGGVVRVVAPSRAGQHKPTSDFSVVASPKIEAVQFGGKPRDCATDGTHMWVLSKTADDNALTYPSVNPRLIAFHLGNGSRVEGQDIALSGYPSNPVEWICEAGGVVYALQGRDVQQYSTTTRVSGGGRVARLPQGETQYGIACDGTHIYALSEGKIRKYALANGAQSGGPWVTIGSPPSDLRGLILAGSTLLVLHSGGVLGYATSDGGQIAEATKSIDGAANYRGGDNDGSLVWFALNYGQASKDGGTDPSLGDKLAAWTVSVSVS
ncbi:MAG: hypothetical protein OXG44_11860 [Gammaproteobacteria bacterium]|nr:hypothetical protein [Gammaproteobacteria bacterium]